ncbi:MAG: hypothetical protein KKB09_07165 [Nanoarchaeota archaeon]|nr:hypothetical protein [Nanoarchaeota archaeon]
MSRPEIQKLSYILQSSLELRRNPLLREVTKKRKGCLKNGTPRYGHSVSLPEIWFTSVLGQGGDRRLRASFVWDKARKEKIIIIDSVVEPQKQEVKEDVKESPQTQPEVKAEQTQPMQQSEQPQATTQV